MNPEQIILLVDDSENDVQLMRMAFHRADFTPQLHVVQNGEEAIAYLAGEGIYADRSQYPLPQVMLLDLHMPMKNGFDVQAWISARPKFKRLMVIILTASMRPDDVERAYDLGANGFLVKPPDLYALAEMAHCLRDWLNFNQFPGICSAANLCRSDASPAVKSAPLPSDPARCVIAMAASAGGLHALSVILGGLPADFPAAITIVMHLSPDHESLLADILKCRTPLLVTQARPSDVLCHSRVYVAPPNHHLSVLPGGRLELSSPTAEKIHHSRPSAEPLFATVASVYKKRSIAVVLTGGDGDGSLGVQIIKEKGGTVIAQDQPTSQDFSMPKTSIETGDVDFILPLEEIALKLIGLATACNRKPVKQLA